MSKFEMVSLEEALETTTHAQRLSEEFGEELETMLLVQCPECEGTNLNDDATLCWDCHASDYQ